MSLGDLPRFMRGRFTDRHEAVIEASLDDSVQVLQLVPDLHPDISTPTQTTRSSRRPRHGLIVFQSSLLTLPTSSALDADAGTLAYRLNGEDGESVALHFSNFTGSVSLVAPPSSAKRDVLASSSEEAGARKGRNDGN